MSRFAIALGIGLVLLGCSQQSSAQGFAADMAVRFNCSGSVTPRFESDFETFLTLRGFRVANLERVRRQFNRGFYPLEIEAYDNRRWTVHVISLRVTRSVAPSDTTYNLGVYSPPPTHHDDVLERELVDLIAQQLNCEISALQRSENGSDAKDFYEQVYSKQLSRDYEAEICDKTAKTFDASLCRSIPGAN